MSMGRRTAGLVVAQRRFERWRRTRKSRTIPEELWRLAEELAGRCGVQRTARALRLNYDSLKKRVEGGASESGRPATFVEVVAAGEIERSGAAGACIVEFENARGDSLRVVMKGGVADLEALSAAFWRTSE
jgi:hypothetical protein